MFVIDPTDNSHLINMNFVTRIWVFNNASTNEDTDNWITCLMMGQDMLQIKGRHVQYFSAAVAAAKGRVDGAATAR